LPACGFLAEKLTHFCDIISALPVHWTQSMWWRLKPSHKVVLNSLYEQSASLRTTTYCWHTVEMHSCSQLLRNWSVMFAEYILLCHLFIFDLFTLCASHGLHF